MIVRMFFILNPPNFFIWAVPNIQQNFDFDTPCPLAAGWVILTWWEVLIMPSIISGVLALGLGLWAMSEYWWSFAELMRGLVPLLLVVGGMVALTAGVKMRRKDSGE